MKSAINGGIVAVVGLILIVAAQNSPLGLARQVTASPFPWTSESGEHQGRRARTRWTD